MSRSRSPVSQRCPDHEGKPFVFYCRSCESLACSVCVLEMHRDHTEQVDEAKDALQHHMIRIKDLYEEANVHLEEAQNLLDETNSTVCKLKMNKELAEKRISNYFQKMRSILVDRENHFINAVRRSADEKKQAMKAQHDSASDLVHGLIQCVKGLGDLSSRSSDIMVLTEERTMAAELERMVWLLRDLKDSEVIDTRVTLPCIEDQNFEKVCRLVGDLSFRVCPPECCGMQVDSPSSPRRTPPIPPKPPSKERTTTDPCNAEISSARPLDHRRTKSSNSSFGVTCPVSPPPIPPKLPEKPQSELPPWLLDYKKQSEEKKNNLPKVASDYEPLPPSSPKSPSSPNPARKPPKPKPRKILAKDSSNSNPIQKIPSPMENVVCNGLPMNEFHVNIDPPTPVNEMESGPSLRVYEIVLRQMIDPCTRTKAGVYPSSVCVGPSNTLIVSDPRNSCIRMLTNTGKFLDYIGPDETNENHFNKPVAVCVDKSGNILVLDEAPPRILKFSCTGKYISKLVPKALRSSPLVTPKCMAISHNNNILVTDWSKSCVHVFDSSGKYLKNFGSATTSSGTFMMQPTGITVDLNGRVIICDGMAHSVWIYTPSGDLVYHFGWQGSNAGDLLTPHGVTTDFRGHMYITEEGNSRVSVFKESGEFLKCIGHKGVLLAEFDNPLGLCIDGDNRLIVTDERNQRLQVFDIS